MYPLRVIFFAISQPLTLPLMASVDKFDPTVWSSRVTRYISSSSRSLFAVTLDSASGAHRVTTPSDPDADDLRFYYHIFNLAA